MKTCIMSVWTPNYNHYKYKADTEKLTITTIKLFIFLDLMYKLDKNKHNKGHS